jgi:zinc/manganese transport system permease protein
MGAPALSANPVTDLRELLAYPFMVQALAAGTIVALVAGAVGWYMVTRRQTFAAHTLATMSFPGAAAGVLLGLPGALGYYLACGAAAAVLARRPDAHDPDGGLQSARVGTVQAVGLAAGFVLLAASQGVLGGLDGLLFGSFLGVTVTQVWVLAVVGAVVLAVLAAIARPLLFVSLDPEAAAARGVPVRALEIGFMLLLGVTVAAATQITGALLVFAVLVSPAAAAQQLALRPIQSLMASVALAIGIVWVSLTLAYFSPWPLGFYLTTTAFIAYAVARWAPRAGRRHAGEAVA